MGDGTSLDCMKEALDLGIDQALQHCQVMDIILAR